MPFNKDHVGMIIEALLFYNAVNAMIHALAVTNTRHYFFLFLSSTCRFIIITLCAICGFVVNIQISLGTYQL